MLDVLAISNISVVKTVDSFTVAFAEGESGQGDYLIVQCATPAPTPDDVSTGTDSYCLMDNEGGVAYGGVRRVELAGTRLVFTLSADTAKELGVKNRRHEVVLHIATDNATRMSKALRRILSYGNASQRPELIGI